jgi:hypothetical protein
MQVAMRTAILKDERAKLWAKVNCEDNFCHAIYYTAESAVLDIVCREIEEEEMVAWFNKACRSARDLKAFVLVTCREMYKLLRI